MKSFLLKFVILAAMLLGLPISGVFLTGLPVSRYLMFPPKTRYVVHASFSWTAFIIFFLIIIVLILPFALLFRRAKVLSDKKLPLSTAFPWWGWLGIFLGIISWILAWNRFEWFHLLQPHTFTPLWLSYIIVINGLSYRRTGNCLLINRFGFLLSLFPVSAVFWWFFEYLNRFVQNWYYLGVDFSAWEYFWYATLPFSTVIPAVWSTKQWISSWFRLENRYRISSGSERRLSKGISWIVLIAAAVGLAGIGIFPDYLFPLLWVSPLLILVSLQSLMGESHILSVKDIHQWNGIISAALAALMCGFFWEMWNFYSLAKWEYTIPFVQRFQIFEMPVLGYGGYLPFGLECMAVGQLIEKLPYHAKA